MNPLPPFPAAPSALRATFDVISSRSPMGGLERLHRDLGETFRVPIPGFQATIASGPEWARFVYVTGYDKFLWRAERDPVTRLLRQGLLVQDREGHDASRRQLDPSFRRQLLAKYAEVFVRCTDQVLGVWNGKRPLDMLVEMRRVSLLAFVGTLFGEDFAPYMNELWPAILRVLRFISPGAWIAWPEVPQFGYGRAVRELDRYLYGLILRKRASLGVNGDMISQLVRAGLDDDRIRDHALTMLIAGHDTSTSLLSWTLYLLGQHPEVAARARSEVDTQLGSRPPGAENQKGLTYLGQVIDESLRLYPPIHLSNRIAAEDIDFNGYRIPSGTRVMLSIYLTHRDPEHWPDPERFDPGRFDRENVSRRVAYTYLPFGGGRRNCIGSSFARAEARIVLARILQRFELAIMPHRVRARMGATLEPRPGVFMIPMPRTAPARALRRAQGAAA